MNMNTNNTFEWIDVEELNNSATDQFDNGEIYNLDFYDTTIGKLIRFGLVAGSAAIFWAIHYIGGGSGISIVMCLTIWGLLALVGGKHIVDEYKRNKDVEASGGERIFLLRYTIPVVVALVISVLLSRNNVTAAPVLGSMLACMATVWIWALVRDSNMMTACNAALDAGALLLYSIFAIAAAIVVIGILIWIVIAIISIPIMFIMLAFAGSVDDDYDRYHRGWF